MKKVWLVTEGCYSDYHIVAAFSSEEAASAYAEERDESFRGDGCHVEEYELDKPRADLGGAFIVRIGQGGEVRDVKKGTYHEPSEPARRIRERRVSTYYRAMERGDESSGSVAFAVNEFEGFGLTQEGARRSADELRRATLAIEGSQEDQYDAWHEEYEAEERARERRYATPYQGR